MTTYPFEPLKSGYMRLFEVEKGADERDLSGRMHIVPVNSPNTSQIGAPHPVCCSSFKSNHETKCFGSGPSLACATSRICSDGRRLSFHALSHHWGLKGGEDVVRVAKDDQLYTIQIRKSLVPALKELRRRITYQNLCPFLWIDAICINQADDEDKMMQIPQMAQIYNGACHVIVWLGEKENDSDLAISFIERLQHLEHLTDFLEDPNNLPNWKALAKLTQRPWFDRRWIVQEISVARKAVLLCGSVTVSWDFFAGAVSLFASLSDTMKTKLRMDAKTQHHPDYLGEIMESGANKLIDLKDAVIRQRDDGSIAEHLISLEALITSLSGFQVSNPHDTINAILGLAHDARPDRHVGRPSALEHKAMVSTPRTSNPPSPTSGITPDIHTVNVLSAASDKLLSVSQNDVIVRPANEQRRRGRGRPRPANLELPMEKHSSNRYSQDETSAQQAEQYAAPKRRTITVDYGKPVYDMCKNVLEHIFNRSKSLDILCFPWAPEPRGDDLTKTPPATKEPAHPTWLLQRNDEPFGHDRNGQQRVYRRVRADPLVGRPGNGPRIYLACGRWKPKAYIDGRCLVAQGWKLDVIDEVEDTAAGGIIQESWLDMAGWHDLNCPPPDKFWRTLIADRALGGKLLPPAHYKMACKWAFRQKADRGDLNARELLTHGNCNDGASQFLRRMLAVVWGRRLFTVRPSLGSDGLLGLGNKKVRAGDILCILKGCSVPIVLREVRKRTYDQADLDGPTITVQDCGDRDCVSAVVDVQKEYEFIGEAYVHGMMSGECFQYLDDRGTKSQDFRIV